MHSCIDTTCIAVWQAIAGPVCCSLVRATHISALSGQHALPAAQQNTLRGSYKQETALLLAAAAAAFACAQSRSVAPASFHGLEQGSCMQLRSCPHSHPPWQANTHEWDAGRAVDILSIACYQISSRMLHNNAAGCNSHHNARLCMHPFRMNSTFHMQAGAAHSASQRGR